MIIGNILATKKRRRYSPFVHEISNFMADGLYKILI